MLAKGFSVAFATLLCFALPPRHASSQVFHDDFDGAALDPAVWSVEAGDGQIVVANGVASLSCSGTTFPVATTIQDPFPPGDFRVRVRMRYSSVAWCGNGFGAMDNFWEDYYGDACRPFLLWQDQQGWYSYSGGTGYYYIGTGPNTDFHIYEWTYFNGRYTFSLDGTTLSSGDCAPRATRLFFGHPHPISCSNAWTSLEIDYIHVEPFDVTLTQTNPLGLGWSGCSSANPMGTANVNDACEHETVSSCRVYRLLPTFVSSITDSRFTGSTTVIDVLIGSSPTIGSWWYPLAPSACRSVPALSTVGNITAAGTCSNPYPAGAGTLPGQQSAPSTGSNPLPNRIRITSTDQVNPLQQVNAGIRYYAMQLEVKNEGTLASCDPATDPTPVCVDGCLSPACFVLNQVSVFFDDEGTADYPDFTIHYSHDGTSRNFATWQGGTGGNCPGATPTRKTTWGAVKALYR